jgi:hypothetical protein
MKLNNFVSDIPFIPAAVSEYRDFIPLMASWNRTVGIEDCREGVGASYQVFNGQVPPNRPELK